MTSVGDRCVLFKGSIQKVFQRAPRLIFKPVVVILSVVLHITMQISILTVTFSSVTKTSSWFCTDCVLFPLSSFEKQTGLSCFVDLVVWCCSEGSLANYHLSFYFSSF